MQPSELEVLRRQPAAHGFGGVSGLDGEPELGVQDAGGGVNVGMGVNARGHPKEYVLFLSGVAGQPVQQVQFVEAVHHHPSDRMVQGFNQLLGGLVVAVEIDFVKRDAGADGGGQLAPGHHVEPHPLLLEQPGQRRVDVGLAGVADAAVGVTLSKLADELPAAGPNRLLVQNVDGRAVLLGQFQGAATADDQMAVAVDFSGVRKYGVGEHSGKPPQN